MGSKTLFMLMAEFDGRTAVPLSEVLHYTNFSTISEANKAANAGSLAIPAFRMANSQKSPYIVHLEDLAASIDQARQRAIEHVQKISGKAPITSKQPSHSHTFVAGGPTRRGRRNQQGAMQA